MNKWESHQPVSLDTAEHYLTEVRGPFWRAVYDSAVTEADNDQLWASLTEVLRDLIGTLKDLIMTLYRCHLCHLWGLSVGLPRYTGPDNLATVRLWFGTCGPLGWTESRSTAKFTVWTVSKLRLTSYLLIILQLSFNFLLNYVINSLNKIKYTDRENCIFSMESQSWVWCLFFIVKFKALCTECKVQPASHWCKTIAESAHDVHEATQNRGS